MNWLPRSCRVLRLGWGQATLASALSKGSLDPAHRPEAAAPTIYLESLVAPRRAHPVLGHQLQILKDALDHPRWALGRVFQGIPKHDLEGLLVHLELGVVGRILGVHDKIQVPGGLDLLGKGDLLGPRTEGPLDALGCPNPREGRLDEQGALGELAPLLELAEQSVDCAELEGLALLDGLDIRDRQALGEVRSAVGMAPVPVEF